MTCHYLPPTFWLQSFFRLNRNWARSQIMHVSLECPSGRNQGIPVSHWRMTQVVCVSGYLRSSVHWRHPGFETDWDPTLKPTNQVQRGPKHARRNTHVTNPSSWWHTQTHTITCCDMGITSQLQKYAKTVMFVVKMFHIVAHSKL